VTLPVFYRQNTISDAKIQPLLGRFPRMACRASPGTAKNCRIRGKGWSKMTYVCGLNMLPRMMPLRGVRMSSSERYIDVRMRPSSVRGCFIAGKYRICRGDERDRHTTSPISRAAHPSLPGTW